MVFIARWLYTKVVELNQIMFKADRLQSTIRKPKGKSLDSKVVF